MTGEVFPLPLLPDITIAGAGPDRTILDAEQSGGVISIWHDNRVLITGLTLTGGIWRYGAGLNCFRSTPVITNCRISNNNGTIRGGGIHCRNCELELINCILSENTAWRQGGAAYLTDSQDCAINFCTFVNNVSDHAGGAIGILHSEISIRNTILWGNLPAVFNTADGAEIDAAYCDIAGGYSGAGIIDADPLFIAGPCGEWYLSRTETGQTQDSPCVDTGNQSAADACFPAGPMNICMDDLTTRTDEMTDAGVLDLGYHYTCKNPEPTTTPSPEATAIPTVTPAPVETCKSNGVTLWMPARVFEPGMTCACKVFICNTSTKAWIDIPLFIILDVHGQLFFGPSFSEFDYFSIPIPPGLTERIVLTEFTWPEYCGVASGITFYAGMTNPEMTVLFGNMDSWTFGWFE